MSTNTTGATAEGDETKSVRMLESMGWLTESILIPRKGKAIDGVGAGSLVDLKAQFYLSQEQARVEKESGELRRGRKRKNNDGGLSDAVNKGVAERDHKDRLQLKTKDEAEAAALGQLEKKAELYNQLLNGHVTEDETELYEVDFLEKRFEDQAEKNRSDGTSERDPEEEKERRRRRELVLEQAGLTKKGREKAAQIKEARLLQQKQKRERIKAAFIQKQLTKLRNQQHQSGEIAPPAAHGGDG